jgi:hypothetical protein
MLLSAARKQPRLLAPPTIDEQTGDRRRAEPERQADHQCSNRRRRLRQHGDDPGRSAQHEQRNAKGKAGSARDGHERPVTAELWKIWGSEHRVRRQERRQRKTTTPSGRPVVLTLNPAARFA